MSHAQLFVVDADADIVCAVGSVSGVAGTAGCLLFGVVGTVLDGLTSILLGAKALFLLYRFRC
ncbi:hypothetical protein LDG_5378 [Legionella drancourtii LLAP12]|uniref:Uncharacterized protein n=1 Tax=Legionella drancourtii LLAP12 TaxID=658187 RepID=G9EJL2_9GAMM|nr:hypothetical protein LDG_5378 [Legionella drancourtii LLAP12]